MGAGNVAPAPLIRVCPDAKPIVPRAMTAIREFDVFMLMISFTLDTWPKLTLAS
jgi:hypothetical protein